MSTMAEGAEINVKKDSYEVNRSDAWEIPQQMLTKETLEASTSQIFSVGLTSQIEEAKKDIAEKVKKCETEIVEYAVQEIQKYKNRTLNYIDDVVKKITDDTWKRRTEAIQNLAENIQQGHDFALCYVIQGLQEYKKDTLKIIEEDALKQVEKAVNKIAEKVKNVTMEHLVNLIENPLNEILKDSRKQAVDQLNLIDRKLSEYLQLLHFNGMSNSYNIAMNEQQRYKEEIMKLLEKEIPMHFREGLDIFYDQLKKREEEVEEYLNREAIQRSEEAINRLIQEVAVSAGNWTEGSVDHDPEGFRQNWRPEVNKCIMEEVQRHVKTMRIRVKVETQTIQKIAVNFLSHEAKNCGAVSFKKKMSEGNKNITESMRQFAEKCKYSETKYQNLFKEAEEYLEDGVERIIEQAVKKVTDVVMLRVQETLRSALKHSARSELIPIVGVSSKWVIDVLLSCLKGFQNKEELRL